MSKKEQIDKKISFSKTCTLCRREPVIGLIDFNKGATHVSLCMKHLKEFCKSTLEREE